MGVGHMATLCQHLLMTAPSLLFFSQAVVLNPVPKDQPRVHLDMDLDGRSLITTCGGDSGATALTDCAACGFADPTAPRLYILETSEGSGSRIQSIIYGMALAAMNGMNLGGVVSLPGCGKRKHPDGTHGTDVGSTVSALFGLKNGDNLFIDKKPHCDRTFEMAGDLADAFINGSDLTPLSSVMLSDGLIATSLDHWTRNPDHFPLSYFMNPVFLAYLRRGAHGLLNRPLVFDAARPSVALHIRRADVVVGNRLTTDEWNLKMIDEVRALLPGADVHIFSALAGNWKNESFDVYRERGCTVHLEEVDVLDAWANFAHADVLITAKSSFSMLPALLNDKCVLYQSWWLQPLPGWVVASDGFFQETKDQPYQLDKQALADCLKRVQQRSANVPEDGDAPPSDDKSKFAQIMEERRKGRADLDLRLAAKEKARLEKEERKRQGEINRAAREAAMKQAAIDRRLRTEAMQKKREEQARLKAEKDAELAIRKAEFQRLKEEREREKEEALAKRKAMFQRLREERETANKAKPIANSGGKVKAKRAAATATKEKINTAAGGA